MSSDINEMKTHHRTYDVSQTTYKNLSIVKDVSRSNPTAVSSQQCCFTITVPNRRTGTDFIISQNLSVKACAVLHIKAQRMDFPLPLTILPPTLRTLTHSRLPDRKAP